MSGLGHHDGDGGGGVERCRLCDAVAVGPCASCGAPVCGDCCILTEGGLKVWAVCTRCEGRGAGNLAPAWLRLVAWLGAILAVLAAAVVAAGYFARR